MSAFCLEVAKFRKCGFINNYTSIKPNILSYQNINKQFIISNTNNKKLYQYTKVKSSYQTIILLNLIISNKKYMNVHIDIKKI